MFFIEMLMDKDFHYSSQGSGILNMQKLLLIFYMFKNMLIKRPPELDETGGVNIRISAFTGK